MLPIDISLAYYKQSEVEAKDETASMEAALRLFWQSFYWTAQGFSFILVPIVMNYEISGEFD